MDFVKMQVGWMGKRPQGPGHTPPEMTPVRLLDLAATTEGFRISGPVHTCYFFLLVDGDRAATAFSNALLWKRSRVFL